MPLCFEWGRFYFYRVSNVSYYADHWKSASHGRSVHLFSSHYLRDSGSGRCTEVVRKEVLQNLIKSFIGRKKNVRGNTIITAQEDKTSLCRLPNNLDIFTLCAVKMNKSLRCFASHFSLFTIQYCGRWYYDSSNVPMNQRKLLTFLRKMHTPEATESPTLWRILTGFPKKTSVVSRRSLDTCKMLQIDGGPSSVL